MKLSRRSFLILIIIVLIFHQFCYVRTSPDKIWGIRGKIVRLTESLKGIRYVYGGTEIYGFDCSGLVNYIYTSFGINVPRTAKQQGKLRPAVKFKHAKPGDILVFKISRRKWHSGIYVSEKYFIHAPNGRGFVRSEKYSKYWMKKLKKVISILSNK